MLTGSVAWVQLNVYCFDVQLCAQVLARKGDTKNYYRRLRVTLT